MIYKPKGFKQKVTGLALAKKALGQHWLNDAPSLKAICDAAEVGADDTVLEIGPGQGSLTKLLVERAKQVIAVEFDEFLASRLKSYIQRPNLDVICADILSFDFGRMPPGYKVVANIPYYLTSHLLRQLSETPNPPSLAVLLVQKEVAQRAAASPGQMSILSVSLQFYYEVTLGLTVPARLFTPPPKVDSQILILNCRTGSLFPDATPKSFFRLVKAGFSSRRKTLQNSLSAGLHISKLEAATLLSSAGIEPNQRAQELSLDDWHRLRTHAPH